MRRRLAGLAPAAAASLVLALVGCSSAPRQIVEPPEESPTSAGSPASGSPSGSGTGSGATAGLTGGTPTGSASSSVDCTPTVGSQLRERTTVTTSGAVTLLAGSIPCRSVGVWVSSFTLDDDPAADPTPRFAGRYTGISAVSAKVPSVSDRCAAAAVYFAVDAEDATDAARAAGAARAVRTDLAYWPPGQPPTVPAAGILQGRTSIVLAAAVVGDPARCSPGENVATPLAALGDCWLAAAEGASPSAGSASPASASSAGGQGGGAGFRKTTCTTPHTHEVYWAESLTPQAYLDQTRAQGQTASTWARKRAEDVCGAKRSTLRLAADVRAGDVYLELLWPSALEYPPRGEESGWSKAQVVCLARWKDGRASARQLLRAR